MNNHILNPDTQASLLLCGYLGQPVVKEPKPLTLSEYNQVAGRMVSLGMRPSDLLSKDRLDKLSDFSWRKVTYERIRELMARGASLAFTVEEWTKKGIWIISRADEDYPGLLKSRLHGAAPVILYGVGNRELINSGGLAIVGARDVDEEGLEFTRHVSFTCAGQGITVVSGGARGVDQEAMFAALKEGGNVLGVIANSLSKAAVSRKYRKAVKAGNLLLVSPFDPESGFSVGNLMGRNRYIYTLAHYALVISSAEGKGGTWTGSTENLDKKWVPLFIRSSGNIPDGNTALIEKGGIPMNREATIPESKFRDWLDDYRKEFEDKRKADDNDMENKKSLKKNTKLKTDYSKAVQGDLLDLLNIAGEVEDRIKESEKEKKIKTEKEKLKKEISTAEVEFLTLPGIDNNIG